MRTREYERARPLDGEHPERTAERQPRALDVLALQRSAGNAAVSALLAREPVAEELKSAEKADTSATGTVTLTGIGAIPLLAFSMGGSGRSKGESSFEFTSKPGPHSDKLIRALTEGTVVDAEVVLTSGLKIKLLKASIASYSTSGSEGVPIEHWTLAGATAVIGDKEQAADTAPDRYPG